MPELFYGPPALIGDEQAQLVSMYRYLQTMSDQLNTALSSITTANFAPEEQLKLNAAMKGASEGTKQEITNTRNTLRSLIIKTAEIVRTEMDELRTTLTSSVTAISEQFGELDRELTNTITATAEGVSQNYTYIESLISRVDGVDDFVTRTNNYIFSGLISYDSETGMPIYGIAVGEDITQYDGEGNPSLNDNAKVATFTKDRLSFWQGSTEMAYFSNNRLYVKNVEVLNTMKTGNYIWKIQADGSMGLTYSAQES